MTSNHVLWFVTAICTLIASFLLWLWGIGSKPSHFPSKRLLGYVGAIICLTSSAIIVWIVIVIMKTMLARIWLNA